MLKQPYCLQKSEKESVISGQGRFIHNHFLIMGIVVAPKAFRFSGADTTLTNPGQGLGVR
ncbi:hypothetical protein TUM17576_48070 [Enterobacter hormaechei]|nr:hypothetical protein TUM17576_48070 [Enterobacter hormaechei]